MPTPTDKTSDNGWQVISGGQHIIVAGERLSKDIQRHEFTSGKYLMYEKKPNVSAYPVCWTIHRHCLFRLLEASFISV